MWLKKIHHKKYEFWCSRNVSIISITLFLIIMGMVIGGNRYMNRCIQKEESARQDQLALKELGEELAKTSDYLTNEVRKYAATKEIVYLYHYWYEVKVERRRDYIIESLKKYNLPNHEVVLLEKAKAYSDELIATETYAMKLILINDKTPNSEGLDRGYLNEFVEEVLAYKLPDEIERLSQTSQREKSLELLYDINYEAHKGQIMKAIEAFQNTMNGRLDREVNKVVANRTRASLIQIICSAGSLVLVFILLVVIYYFYVYPLVGLTECIKRVNKSSTLGEINLEELALVPKGVYELKSFVRIFNNLVLALRHELDMRKKIEKDIRGAKEEAEQANRSKSEFLASISHELRTPLNAMIGYLFLLGQSHLDKQQKAYCEKINYATEHLMSLINEVLDFSKIESGNMVFEEVDFNLLKLIDEVRAVMENEIAKKGLAFIVKKDEQLPRVVCGDAIKLKQVLINLLNNALKFTSKGMITLQIQLIQEEDKRYVIQFSVSDTGIGIKEEDQQRILEPFVQEDASITRKYGGTGLGLAICQRIIQEASHGEESLEIRSALGEGTTFQFIMSFKVGEAVLIQEQDIEKAFIRGEKQILLVDNNEINLAMESEIIRYLGIEVKTASCGEEAIKMVQQYKFDMIFMDIRMPHMDGYEVTSRIRAYKNYKEVPIIALSADVVTQAIDKSKEYGMNEYMAKPLRIEKLYGLINKYLGISISNVSQSNEVSQPIFAAKECLEILNGNERLLIELVKRFLITEEKIKEAVEAAIRERQFEVASKLLHDLLGLSGNLRCYQLYEVTSKLNEAVRHKEEIGEELLVTWGEIWEMTQSELEHYIEAQCSLKEEEQLIEVSYESIKVQLIALCEVYDLGAAELFVRYSGVVQQHLGEKLYQVLQDKMANYDFEGIIETLKSVTI